MKIVDCWGASSSPPSLPLNGRQFPEQMSGAGWTERGLGIDGFSLGVSGVVDSGFTEWNPEIGAMLHHKHVRSPLEPRTGQQNPVEGTSWGKVSSKSMCLSSSSDVSTATPTLFCLLFAWFVRSLHLEPLFEFKVYFLYRASWYHFKWTYSANLCLLIGNFEC